MKKFLITSLVAILNVAAFGQGTIWATANNIDKIRESNEFRTAITSLRADLIFYKAHPASKKRHLQNVYEFVCTCTETDLYTALHKVPGLSDIRYDHEYEISGADSLALDSIDDNDALFITTDDININKDKSKSLNVSDYQIYDMTGKLVNIEYAPAGMYLVVDNGVTVTKIIK